MNLVLTLLANTSAGMLQNRAHQQQRKAKMLVTTAKISAGVAMLEPLYVLATTTGWDGC